METIDAFLRYPFKSPLWNPVTGFSPVGLFKGNLLRPGFNPGNYKYLGPGNRLDGSTPINKLDEIAMRHDMAYEEARNRADILKADDDFIKETGNISMFNTPMASVANIVMRTKRGIESTFGQMYPLNSTLARRNLEDRIEDHKQRTRPIVPTGVRHGGVVNTRTTELIPQMTHHTMPTGIRHGGVVNTSTMELIPK